MKVETNSYGSILDELNKKFDGTDQSAMDLAYYIAHTYSSCKLCGVGKGVGAIIVKNKEIICFGYNGMVDNITPCTKDTCLCITREEDHKRDRNICYGDCAEKRAFINAYKNKIDLSNSTIYITKSPCISCCKLIINLGINEVIYDSIYSNSGFSFELLREANIKHRLLKNDSSI